MPKRRWLITRLDLLVAQAVGYRLRKTSAFQPLTATAGPTPTGKVEQPYRATLTVAGGVPPYFCSISSGTLPSGLCLNSFTGEIAGVPREAGRFAFTVVVRDDPASRGVSVPVKIEVAGARP